MQSKAKIKVMIVDDHPVMRRGLKDVLEESGFFEVVGLAGDGEAAVQSVGRIRPEVVVMDAIMPRKDGIDACREIMEVLPDTRVIMLTASTEEDAVLDAVAAGASGHVRKDLRPEDLVATVVEVAQGRLRFPDESVRKVFAMLRGDGTLTSRKPSAILTSSELQTLVLFASGKTYARIAETRGVSVVTIRNTLYRVQEKLDAETKQELVIWAVRNGLLDDVVIGESSRATPRA